MTEIEAVRLDHIQMDGRHRALDAKAVSSLQESIREIGLQTPIHVRYVEEREIDGETVCNVPVLVAGAHRLAAARALGWETIPCLIIDGDEIDAELWEIDENLMRAELTPAQEADHMARRKKLWEQKETATSCRGFEGRGNTGFSFDTATVTGKSQRDIQRAVSRGEKIAPDVLANIQGTALDKGTHLDALAKLPHEEQRRAVTLGNVASMDAKKLDAADAKHEADDKIADLLASFIPGEHWDALKANLYTAGYKALAQAFTRLIGVSVFDNTTAGRE